MTLLTALGLSATFSTMSVPNYPCTLSTTSSGSRPLSSSTLTQYYDIDHVSPRQDLTKYGTAAVLSKITQRHGLCACQAGSYGSVYWDREVGVESLESC